MSAIKLWRVLIVAVLVGVLLAAPHARVGAGGQTVLRVDTVPAPSDELGNALIRCRDLERQAALDDGCRGVWDRNFQRLLGQELPETAVVPRNMVVVPGGRVR